MKNNYLLGRSGENIAKNYYLNNGYNLIRTNYNVYSKYSRGRQGEIDLIFTKKNLLVIVEVKSRDSQKFGNPLLQITSKKLNLMQKSYQVFIQKNQNFKTFKARFDLCTIENGNLSVLKNAFSFDNFVY
jgi:putative endonuclease